MFHYEYPEFKNNQLLTAEMLESLGNAHRCQARLLYQGYGNGIVNGCELSWNEGWLSINSGVVHWNGNLYWMEKPYRLECRPEDHLLYVVVKFQNEKKETNRISSGTNIYLRKEPVRTQDEMELCRFRLQKGSRLRSAYQDFRDYSTEFDTLNIIHAPHAAGTGITINPSILVRFAEEMLETDMADAFDIGFVMNILANDGRISRRGIREYLKKASNVDPVPERNGELYQELLSRLSSRKRLERSQQKGDEMPRRIMLM